MHLYYLSNDPKFWMYSSSNIDACKLNKVSFLPTENSNFKPVEKWHADGIGLLSVSKIHFYGLPDFCGDFKIIKKGPFYQNFIGSLRKRPGKGRFLPQFHPVGIRILHSQNATVFMGSPTELMDEIGDAYEAQEAREKVINGTTD